MDYHWREHCAAALERFAKFVRLPADPNDPDACHEWTGAKSRGSGHAPWYGSFHVVGSTKVRAHIFVCVAAGIAVKGLHIDHTCHNTLCVRLSHLEPVTNAVNSARRWALFWAKREAKHAELRCVA